MKKIIFFIITLLLIAPIQAQAGLFDKDYLKDAKSYFEITDYQRVVTILEEGFNKNKIVVSNQPDAYKLLGVSYKNLGYTSKSQENFRKATACSLIQGKTTQAFFFLDSSQLEKLEPLILKTALKNRKLGQLYSHDIMEIVDKSLSTDDIPRAIQFSELAIKLQPETRTNLSKKFLEASQVNNNHQLLKVAAKLAINNQKMQKKVLGVALQKAVHYWPNERFLYFKEIANSIDRNKTQEIFPGGTEDKPLFSWQVTLANQDKDFNIKVFNWQEVFNSITPGDRLVIVCEIPGQKNYIGIEVMWYKGKWYKEEERWGKTEKGKAAWPLKGSLNTGGFYLRIPEQGKNVVATVKIVRKVKKGPQKQFLANI